MQQKHTPHILLLLLFAALSASAQSRRAPLDARHLSPAIHREIPALLPQENIPAYAGSEIVANSGVQYRSLEENVGSTTWDAQAYGSMPPRMYSGADGEPIANWLFSNQASGQTDRGTTQNVRKAGVWGNAPVARVEANRTGFPAAVRLGDGSELIVSHNTGQTPFKLWAARKAAGSNTWTESAINGPAGIGMLWPTMAVGGANNNVVHVIAITTPVANVPGVVYEGVDGHPLYFRSKDGGKTWDKTAVILPGIDKTKFNRVAANSYVIGAQGDNVAVAVFVDWNDLFILKSTDGGNTWTKKMVYNFPDKLENYDGNPAIPYDSTDLVYESPVANAPAINTNDGFGQMLVDGSGEAHLFVGRSIVVDTDFSDTTTSYYPTANGIWYWKESFGEANAQLIGGAFDYDGNGQININSSDFSELAFYGGNSLSSFPAVSLGKNGDIYMVYAATNEQYTGNDKYYHTLYGMRSTNGGLSWGEVVELTVKDFVDESLIGFVECVWPSVPTVTDGNLRVLYQQDFSPGTAIWGNVHPNDGSLINYFEVAPDFFPPSEVSTFEPQHADPAFELALSPNPATERSLLSATLRGDGPAVVEIFDLFGKKVQQVRMAEFSGRQHLALSLSGLPKGTYSVRVTEGSRFGVTKLLRM
ncbi:MAG TPA: T9SS type A sorting domain-containing protein [Saprospiraceae bacterium]|nr:T9SS type A sorting domain-containing protein [Saprospiraceae bacterium]